jgi:predicted dehydrogenase
VNPLNVAVIGGGHLGRIHTRLLCNNPNFRLLGVTDTDPSARRSLEEEFQVRTRHDYRGWLPDLDAAVIATPTIAHFPIAAELLSRGIHTLIEKPVTNTEVEADQLIQLADRHQSVLQVGHVERFNAAFQEAVRRLPGPRYIEARRMSGYTMRSVDVGVVLDLMIHDIDLIGSLVSSPLVDVRAVGVSVFGPHEDIAQARLEFSDGTVANLTASRCSFQPARTIAWFNERGYVSADLSSGELQQVQLSRLIDTCQPRDIQQFTNDARHEIQSGLFDSVLPRTVERVEPQNAIECEHNDFARAIRGNRVARVTGRHGRRAVAIARSIVDAIEQHRWQDGVSQRVGPQGQKIQLLPVGGNQSPERKAG